ncbi:LL-diaminopimelate aminotransferase [Aerococcaceae bacterium WGS1372]
MKINPNFNRLPGNYLFNNINQKVFTYQEQFPDKELIKLTIGDVTLPMVDSVIDELIQASEEQKDSETFKGYGPSSGYSFLKKQIIQSDYQPLDVELEEDEIFISDGSKTDAGAIQELFSIEAKIAIGDPAYPTYIDSNVMAGRLGDYNSEGSTWSDLIYIPMNEDNNYQPLPEDLNGVIPDVIYICSPNNPTGVALNKNQLQSWVDFANEYQSVIIFDGAYYAFIQEEDIPRSIYECVGAKQCAIELRSFSKTAGFTGLRLGYTVIPKELVFEGHSLNEMWARRQPIKFNGAPYIIQKAAQITYRHDVQKQLQNNIKYYQRNAAKMLEAFKQAGIVSYGGVNAPYVWLKTPRNLTSWEYFDELLNEQQLVVTPGSGYGRNGEGFMRLTAFGNNEATEEAIDRIVNSYFK